MKKENKYQEGQIYHHYHLGDCYDDTDNEVLYIDIIKKIADRSTCIRRKVGAIFVSDDGCILSIGYNSSPIGIRSCDKLDHCMRKELEIPSGQRIELCYAVHAEQNAIISAMKRGISVRGSTLYCTHFPCVTCAKMLIQSGVKAIKFLMDYKDELAKQLLEIAKVKVARIEE